MSEKIIDFLLKLKQNNDREWFKENKHHFEEAKQEFKNMVDFLIPALAVSTPALANLEAKDTIFRIYRDVRFGKDKSPYKTSMGAILAPGGRKSTFAGHYLHIEPGGSFLAGGLYAPPSDVLKKIRLEIYYNSAEFKGIINSENFKKHFNLFEDHKLKRPPVGFDKNFEDIELLKYKSYTIINNIKDNEICSGDFLQNAVGIFELMNPFNSFLNRGLVEG